MSFTYLPPANEVCEGYVFTGVCHSVHGEGRAWLLPGGHAWLLWGACMAAPGGVHGFSDEIRSMSGRYASYWNAFLSTVNFTENI